MNKILPTALRILLLALVALMIPSAHALATPNLQFDKTNETVAQNATITLAVTINVDANSAQSSRATIKYASADLEVIQVAKGSFFPEFTWANDAGSGTLELTGYTTTPNSGVTANGQLATITLKAKKNTGSSVVSFGCDGGYHDSNILTVGGDQILLCTQTNQTNLTYTGTGVTPTPTPPPGSTPTPTPIQSNNTIPVCSNLSADKTTATGTPLAVTFTCYGVDTDGYINAAYFDFGDGATNTITKNVGSPGSISTTHTYTTIGSLGASCKVQDNNKVWSSVPEVCKKIIYIKPKPKVVVLPNTTTTRLTPTPTPKKEVTLTFVSPTATPSPELTPLPVEEEQPSSPSAPTGILLASVLVIAIGGAIYFLAKRHHGSPPHIPPMNQPVSSPPTPTPQTPPPANPPPTQ